jgi:subtilisin family serine protease
MHKFPQVLFVAVLALVVVSSTGVRADDKLNRTEQILQEAHQSPDEIAADVGQILHRARYARKYDDDCNLGQLMDAHKAVSDEVMNLMALRDSTLGKIMEMAENLRSIFAQMEKLFPGGPNAADYVLKPTQATLGNLGPIGKVMKGVTQILENYAKWHNADQAKEIGSGIKANAKTQVDAIKGAQEKLNQITLGLTELNGYVQHLKGMIETYPKRCQKGSAVAPDASLALGETDPRAIQTSVAVALEGLDKCDLDRLIQLLAFMVQQNREINKQLNELSAQIIGQFGNLNAALAKFDSALPKYELKDIDGLLGGLDSVKEGATGSLGATGGADFSGAKSSDFSPLANIDAAIKRAKAEQDLKKAAKAEMDKLKSLIAQRDKLMGALGLVWAKQRELSDLINSWEERCQKKRPLTGLGMGTDTALESALGENGVSVATDSPEWCTYRSGNPTTYTPGGGDDPRDVGGPTGGGDDPRDVGRPSGGGDDPRDVGRPTGGGDDPRDVGGPSSGGDDPRDVGNDCERELEILQDFMASDEGAALVQSAKNNARDANDLVRIKGRMQELEETCPEGGGEPRDAGTPGGLITRPRDKDDGEDPEDTGEPTVVIYVKAKSSALQQENRTVAGQQIKLFAVATTNVALPGKGADKSQADHDQEPIQGTTDDKGNLVLAVPGSALGLKSTSVAAGTALEIQVNTTAQSSVNAQLANGDTQSVVGALPTGLSALLTDINVVNGNGFLTFTFPASMGSSVDMILARIPGVVNVQVNYCRDKQLAANDPLYKGNKAWGQKYDNQWAIKRVGLSDDKNSAWNLLGENPSPVIVAVIDTGLDWNHLDIDWENIWRNPDEKPDNGIDDDGNGYVDDIIGWDFFGNSNNAWDHDGHGTFVTGIIAATKDNEIGIAGINPHARIMVLKALNSFGHTRASYLAKAIIYAVDNGARIINMSVGGKELATIEEEAIKYAVEKGVLVVVASGNEGIDVSKFGIAGLEGVMTVAASGLKDERLAFSNWGANVDIAAPGIEVLSLRARRTDTMRDIPGVKYENGANYVGADKRYYRASGTSFAAPIVSGVASLMLSKNPGLTAGQVKTILEQTADDVEVAGYDQYTGYGLVNAVAALNADANFFVKAFISGVTVIQTDKGPGVQVNGTALADQLSGYQIDLGAGEEPAMWTTVASGESPVEAGVLGTIAVNNFQGSAVWMLRLKVKHKNGETQEFRFRLQLG